MKVFSFYLYTLCIFLNLVPQSYSMLFDTLENGLQVAIKENHTAPVAAIRIYVKTGSIYEQEYLGSGIFALFRASH